MVSLEKTTNKYHGKMASGYEAKRKKQIRWHRENEIVAGLLPAKLTTVLDCPVGTGRFLSLYNERGARSVVGIDASDSMLTLATKKITKLSKTNFDLHVGDATATGLKDKSVAIAVCVRFLDLIDEDGMQKTMKELCRVAKDQIILTIRLGDKYVPKSNTAEHDQKKFWAMVSRLGWKKAEAEGIFDAGWHVVSLARK